MACAGSHAALRVAEVGAEDVDVDVHRLAQVGVLVHEAGAEELGVRAAGGGRTMAVMVTVERVLAATRLWNPCDA